VRTAVVVLLTILVTLPPAVAAVSFNLLQARRSTTALAYDWISKNIPAGSAIVVEGSDLVLMFAPYQLQHMPQLRQRTFEEYAAAGASYLVASSQCYGPYLSAPRQHPTEYAEYMTLFTRGEEVARFVPSREHPGPELRILRVRP
jgi:hypothetical protein